MEAVASQFSGKPYKFHIQRIRLVCAFEAWGRHKDAESEALRVLKSFKAIELGTEPVNLDRRFVPDVEQGGGDKEFGALLGEVVWTLARCASAIQSKEDEVYERLLCMVEELRPWLRSVNVIFYFQSILCLVDGKLRNYKFRTIQSFGTLLKTVLLFLVLDCCNYLECFSWLAHFQLQGANYRFEIPVSLSKC